MTLQPIANPLTPGADNPEGSVAPQRSLAPLLVLTGTFLLTLLAAGYVFYTTRAEAKIRFENQTHNAAREVTDAIDDRVKTAVAMLRGTAGLFAVDNSIDIQHFRTYIERLSVPQDYPGVLGIGMNRRRSDNADSFPVVYLNPQDRVSRPLIVHDAANDGVRNAACELARDRGGPVATARLQMIREVDGKEQPAFFIFLPIYRGGKTPGTVDQRRHELYGYVFCLVHVADLLSQIGRGEPLAVTFDVFDGPSLTPEHQLFSSPTDANGRPSDPVAVSSLPIEGRTWSVVFRARERLSPFIGLLPAALTLGGGIGASLILFLATRAQARARRSAEEGASRLLRSEGALRESEQRFRSMADTAPVLIWTGDPEGRRTYFNKPWLDFTGRSMDQEAGNGWMESIHPDDRPRWLDVYANQHSRHEPFEIEYRLRRHDGEYRWILAHCVPRFSSDGTWEGFVGVCIDHTARKHAEEEERAARADAEALAREAEAAREAAESANRSKDEFVATLSHELRTPLNAILGWSQLLKVGAVDGEEARQGLETIERNAKSQAQLVDDLLDLSRIISGKLRLDVKPVDLPEVIEAALETVRPASDARETNVVPVLDAHAGPVLGDAGRLQQVVWNLLSNAIKFTPRGGQVQVLLCRVDGSAEITVSDTGQGISPEFLPHVFERLRQADSSSTRRHGGLGLGLSIVRHLVELHGGSVRAESPGVGKGSSFTVTLPLSRRKPEAEAKRVIAAEPVAAPTESASEQALSGVNVLVVDDDPDARDLLMKVLSLRGAAVTVVASASEALDSLRRNQPDVLLSDISMPEEDGYELMQKVRALPGERGRVPAAALTAFARKDDRRRAIEAGFQVHLAKPIEPADLARVIATLAARANVPPAPVPTDH